MTTAILNNYVVVDVETVGLGMGATPPKLLCVGFKDKGDEDVIVVEPEEAKALVEKYISLGTIFIFHNASFDLWVLEATFGVTIDKYLDTMVLSYVHNPSGQHSLGSWGDLLELPKLESPDFTEFTPEMATYCARDCEVTHKLVLHLLSTIDPVALDCYLDIDNPYVRNIIDLEHTGVAIDEEAWHVLNATIIKEREELVNGIYALVKLVPGKWSTVKKPRTNAVIHKDNWEVGSYINETPCEEGYKYQRIEKFNPNSGAHIAYALSDLYGWVPKEKSAKTGKPQVTEDILSKLQYPLAQLLVSYSSVNKLYTTYGEALLKRLEQGRLYCSYNNAITLTGRLSSSSPNLQNIPSHGDLGESIRKNFIASPGHKLVGIDLSQFQMRILAWYLYELLSDTFDDASTLWNGFLATPTVDPHSAVAALMFGENFTKEERFISKTLNFGSLFGFGVAKCAAQCKVTIEKAQYFINLQKEKFPSIFALKETIWEEAQLLDNCVFTLYGRRGYYPALSSESSEERGRAERQAFNFLIQGTEADVVKLVQLEITKGLKGYPGAQQILQVHDELIYEVPEHTDVQAFARYLESVVNRDTWLPGLPLEGTAKIGNNWNEVH